MAPQHQVGDESQPRLSRAPVKLGALIMSKGPITILVKPGTDVDTFERYRPSDRSIMLTMGSTNMKVRNLNLRII